MAFNRYAPEWATGTTWTDWEAHLRLYGKDALTEERTDLSRFVRTVV